MKTLSSFLLLMLFYTTGWSVVTPTHDDIYIPMSDGDSLQADVYIPNGTTSGEVILIQTPYNKNTFELSLPFKINTDALLDAQPFIWVIVDWRGFYGSNQADVSNVDRAQDAYDVCEWIAAQSWHADRIGTWGPSALGGVQYNLCTKHHPNHTCAVPLVATGHQSYDSYFYGGVLEEARLNQLDALGYGVSTTVLANPYDNIIWQIADTSTWFADDISIPTLQIGGWYDHNIDKMMDFYTDSRNMAATAVQDEQWLLVGPWVHGGTGAAYVGSAAQGELSYPTAEFKSDSMAWDFFEYYLLDAANGWQNTDLITYFDMGGTDSWLTSNADDIHATSNNILYLDAGNKLISTNGIDSSTFISDPQNPSPTIGGATLSSSLDQGPYDQNSLDSRSDILTFETEALSADVTITGRVKLDLYVSADQADCDISLRLVDVYPSGESMLITDGIKRMRFRGNAYGAADEEFMTAGEVYNVQVDLPFTRYTWKTGHKIKIYLGGNSSIRWDVNLQDGGPMYQSGTGNIANITVHHNATYPSRLILPGDNAVLGVTEDEQMDVTIFPNPATDVIQIGSEEDFKAYQLLDASGKVILQYQALKQDKVDVSKLSKGMYVLRLQTASGRWTQQIFHKQ